MADKYPVLPELSIPLLLAVQGVLIILGKGCAVAEALLT